MKVRPTHSFDRAIRSIIDAVGEDAVAAVVNRSPSLIRKWTDPDHPSYPSLGQALSLDKIYVETTGMPALIQLAYLYQLEAVVAEAAETVEPLMAAVVSLNGAVGAMAHTLADILTDPALDQRHIGPRNKDALLDHIEKIGKELSDLERSVSGNV